jgi:tRNA threonylcarbamoyl adenosine modification protein (Sua5/YciO/YrdC/YwlC family)
VSAAEEFERCISVGGVVVFPADTVYGLACDPDDRFAVQRLYLLKRRPLSKPSAVMFFSVEAALAALPDPGVQTRAAMSRLLPGGVTLLLANPEHLFPLACGDDPSTLGVRVPAVPLLAGVRRAVLQSSANRAGEADPRRLDDVPELFKAAADLVLDGGELPGAPSTVVDLRRFERGGIDAVSIIRAGAVGEDEVAGALSGQFHFDPDSYEEMIRADVPDYDAFQDALVEVSGDGVRSILELGTGTGVTAGRLLARHPGASLVGIDESESMLAAAARTLPAARVDLRVGRLEDPLPAGPFDLVASALCVHHLDGPRKADLFARVRAVLAPGGRFALADVVVAEEPSQATASLTPGYDKPSTVADQLEWLSAAGFDARVTWQAKDLAVIEATATGAGIVGAR